MKLFPQADRQLLPRNPAQGYPRQQGDQYDCWWPQENNPDRQRILDIAVKNPAYHLTFQRLRVISNHKRPAV